MDASERLNRARMSLGKAVTAKDRRDVSPEITSVIANLTAAKAKFADIETTEHELRAILGQGILSQLRRILATASEVPRPNQPSLRRQLERLVANAGETLEFVDVKIDEETAETIIANDPFIRALDSVDPAQNRASLAEIFADIDVDAVMNGASVPPPAIDDVDPVIESRMTSMRPSEIPAVELSGVYAAFLIDPAHDPSLGTAESDLERSWFKRTG